MRRLCCLFLFFAPLSGFSSPPFPGGILDPAGRTAYLAAPGGLEAVDLERGEPVWSSPEAQYPLLVAGDRLYALALRQENRLDVLAFDLNGKGRRVFRTEVSAFPRWVSTAEKPGQSFAFHWTRSRNVLQLEWQASAHSPGAAGPEKHAAGEIRIDLETGRVQTGPAESGKGTEAGRHPLLEKMAVRWQRQLGGQLFAVVAENVPPSRPGERLQKLTFRSWDLRTRKPTLQRELLTGTRPTLLVDLDGQRLWLRDAGITPDQIHDADRQHWSVVSAVDGRVITRVPFLPGIQTATLIDGRAWLLSSSPSGTRLAGSTTKGRRLTAIDLDTGKVLWHRRLGEATK